MPEIEKILKKPYEELTMGEIIVLCLTEYKEEGYKRLEYLNKKQGDKKPMHLGLTNK